MKYWDDEWYTYSHHIESWPHVSPGNIAVCSAVDGYWVAWKDDNELLAEFRFVSRETLTGIESSNIVFL